MGNNELIGLKSNTRNVLKCSRWCCKILSYQEKESTYASDGRNADNRGYSSHSSYIGIHCQRTMQEWRTEVQKSWQELPSQTGGLESLHRQSARTRTRQKIKPARGWPVTIEQFTAVSLPLIEPRKLARDKPWKSLLTFSIALVLKKVKAVHRRAE